MCFILNTRSMIYHAETCHYNDMILQENYQIVDDLPKGYTPCTCCKPENSKEQMVII